MGTLEVGTKVRKNPVEWQPNEFDTWGRGNGIGEVVDVIDSDTVDVRWPTGRCYEDVRGLKVVRT